MINYRHRVVIRKSVFKCARVLLSIILTHKFTDPFSHSLTSIFNRFNEWLDEKNAKSSAAPQPGSSADLRSAARRAGIGKGEITIVRDRNGDAGFHYDSKTLKITKINDRGRDAGIAIGKKIRSVDGVDVRDSNHYKRLAKGKNEFVLRLV